MDILREEANILERLCHDHIIRLIGTYGYHHKELYLLLWPAATRDLASLLNDLDDLRWDGGDRADILERLGELELHDTSAIDNPHAVNSPHDPRADGCPLDYLRRSMGCLTGALKYCHDSDIRHLDLKPENILVSPGQVHLADFGISRDVKNQEHTMTYLEIGTKKWFAPERSSSDKGWSMKSGGDVYSLGLVFLNIATILYGEQQARLSEMLKQVNWKLKFNQLDLYLEQLQKFALVTQEFADESAHTYAPKHIVGLIRRMTSFDPDDRPDTGKIGEELSRLGGLEQIYHNACCKASPRALTRMLDSDYAQVCAKRDYLDKENKRITGCLDTFEAAKETYSMRLNNQQDEHNKNSASLRKKIEDLQLRNDELESQMRNGSRHRSNGPPHQRSNSSGLRMKNTRQQPRSPNQHYSKPVVPATNTVQVPKTEFRASAPRPAMPDMRRSTDSLSGTYAMRTRTSTSRLPQPVNPSTPIRSATPTTSSLDVNLTDSTQSSLASSSVFSRLSRRTTSSGLSPNPSPSASKILQPPEQNATITHEAESDLGNSNVKPTASQVESHLSDEISQFGGSVKDTASQAGTEQSDFASPARVPSLPMAKSWAAIAKDERGLARTMGASAVGKKRRP